MAERITTVTTAASTYDLTTLPVVKAELGITTTTDDTVLALYIGAESLKVAAACGVVFPRETVVDTFRISSGAYLPALMLSRAPVGTITSVYEAGELVPAAEYEVDANAGLLYRLTETDGYRRTWFSEKTVVTYQGGYAAIPAPVADACLQMVKQRYYARMRDPALRSLDITGVSREEYWVGAINDGMPADVDLLLAPYKRVSLV